MTTELPPGRPEWPRGQNISYTTCPLDVLCLWLRTSKSLPKQKQHEKLISPDFLADRYMSVAAAEDAASTVDLGVVESRLLWVLSLDRLQAIVERQLVRPYRRSEAPHDQVKPKADDQPVEQIQSTRLVIIIRCRRGEGPNGALGTLSNISLPLNEYCHAHAVISPMSDSDVENDRTAAQLRYDRLRCRWRAASLKRHFCPTRWNEEKVSA